MATRDPRFFGSQVILGRVTSTWPTRSPNSTQRIAGCMAVFFFVVGYLAHVFFRGYQTPRHRFGSDFLRCVISVVQGGLSFLSKERKGVHVSRRIPTAIWIIILSRSMHMLTPAPTRPKFITDFSSNILHAITWQLSSVQHPCWWFVQGLYYASILTCWGLS